MKANEVLESRKLFEKLKKKYLTGKRKLKKEWKEIGETTGKHISYSVELKEKSGKIHEVSEVSITKECGVIGINVKEDGNLEVSGRINSNELIEKSKGGENG